MRLGIELAVGVIDAVVGCSCCCCCLDCRNEAASDEEQSKEEPTYRRPRNAAGSGRNAYHLSVRCSVIECHKDCTLSPWPGARWRAIPAMADLNFGQAALSGRLRIRVVEAQEMPQTDFDCRLCGLGGDRVT